MGAYVVDAHGTNDSRRKNHARAKREAFIFLNPRKDNRPPTACPFCECNECSATHLVAACCHFDAAREHYAQALGKDASFFATLPPVTLKSCWVCMDVDTTPEGRAEVQVAVAQLGLIALFSEDIGHPNGGGFLDDDSDSRYRKQRSGSHTSTFGVIPPLGGRGGTEAWPLVASSAPTPLSLNSAWCTSKARRILRFGTPASLSSRAESMNVSGKLHASSLDKKTTVVLVLDNARPEASSSSMLFLLALKLFSSRSYNARNRLDQT